MAQTSPWLSVGDAAARLRRTDREVLALIFAKVLDAELRLDHYEIRTESVEAFALRLAAAEKPAVLDRETEADYRRSTADFDDDTPNEEGDDEQ
jgi:hypothetical protein